MLRNGSGLPNTAELPRPYTVLKPTLIGVGLGLVLAAALVRVMATLLFGVSQYDPGTFSVVALLMLGVGIVATLVPAYRATRVDPIVTLRSE